MGRGREGGHDLRCGPIKQGVHLRCCNDPAALATGAAAPGLPWQQAPPPTHTHLGMMGCRCTLAPGAMSTACSRVLLGCSTSSSSVTALSRRCREAAATQACSEGSECEPGCAPFRLPDESRSCVGRGTEAGLGGAGERGLQSSGGSNACKMGGGGGVTCLQGQPCEQQHSQHQHSQVERGLRAARHQHGSSAPQTATAPVHCPASAPQFLHRKPFGCAAPWRRHGPAPGLQSCKAHPALKGKQGLAGERCGAAASMVRGMARTPC